jgi:hypothetical protein
MTKRKKRLSEQLRDAIVASEKSRYRISKETGISEASLSKFVNGVGGLSLEAVDKIGACLRLELKSDSTPPQGEEK